MSFTRTHTHEHTHTHTHTHKHKYKHKHVGLYSFLYINLCRSTPSDGREFKANASFFDIDNMELRGIRQMLHVMMAKNQFPAPHVSSSAWKPIRRDFADTAKRFLDVHHFARAGIRQMLLVMAGVERLL